MGLAPMGAAIITVADELRCQQHAYAEIDTEQSELCELYADHTLYLSWRWYTHTYGLFTLENASETAVWQEDDSDSESEEED